MVVVMGLLFTWIIKKEEHLIRKEIENKTEIMAQQLEIVRGYIAEKQDVINTDPETVNVVFKHLNPAKVGTAISKRISLSTNYIMKQTSLEYRNPENAPDEHEIEMLKQFQKERNKDAIWREDYDEEGKKIIRYMLPLYIKEDCLQCHGKPAYEGELDITGYKKEGYELGELRGAISVIAPAGHMEAAIWTNTLILLITGIVSTISAMFLTYLLIRKFVKKPLSHTVAATRAISSGDLSRRVDVKSGDEFGELAESFNTMAESIEEKTKELEKALRTEKLNNQYQEAMGEIGRLLCIDSSLQKIADEVVNILSGLLGTQFCGILLLDESTKMFHLKSGIGWSNGAMGRIAFTGLSSHADYALKEGGPIVVRDMRTETRFSGASFFRDLGIISGLCVPMLVQNKCIGVIGFYTAQARNFSKSEIDNLQSVGHLIAEVVVRKHDEEQIHVLSQAIEQSPSMVAITDTKGRIEYVNPSFSRITGYAPDEVIGKNPRILKSGKVNPDRYKELWETVTSGNEWRGEFHNRKKNGGLTYESVCITPIINTEGIITHFLKTSEDITERKRIEERLRISYKMASLGQLSAGVCHEILNPVNILSIQIQLLLMKRKNDSNLEKTLNSMLEEIDRITKIADGILEFSRKGELETGKVEINSLLENIMTITEHDMELRNIKIIKEYEEGLTESMADKDKLRQMFLNMITNARDAMPEGGTLTIATQSVKVLGKPFVRIKFTDTGCGIKHEDIYKIFDPFFTTKEEGRGTGLGLSESYGIIINHGGEIHVESEVGRGTTFIIDLPAM